MGKIDEIKLSIESEDFAQRRTGRKGTSYYNGLAAGYREGYRKRASEGKESPDESDNCIKPDVMQQSELFTCKLEGGKDKCRYKAKDYFTCIMLRRCEFASE